MLFGTTTFKCDDCGNTFTDLAMEWNATALLMPMPCLKCGSRHTYPHSPFAFRAPDIYKTIWGIIDKNSKS